MILDFSIEQRAIKSIRPNLIARFAALRGVA
jgi:hypothetical protein